MSEYKVYVTPAAFREIKELPGHVRQRVRRAIDDMETNPRPPEGIALDLSEIELPQAVECEVWRIRIDKWRVLYAVTEAEKVIDVLAVRKRPPYDYGDLNQLLEGVG